MAASFALAIPKSAFQAASQVNKRAADICASMLANCSAATWNNLPCFGYSDITISKVYSKAARAIPIAIDATIGRVESNVFIAVAKPEDPFSFCSYNSSPPNKFSSGTKQSSNNNSAVSFALNPILSTKREQVKPGIPFRSEEHTSELQSRFDLVCRLLLEKKNTKYL